MLEVFHGHIDTQTENKQRCLPDLWGDVKENTLYRNSNQQVALLVSNYTNIGNLQLL